MDETRERTVSVIHQTFSKCILNEWKKDNICIYLQTWGISVFKVGPEKETNTGCAGSKKKIEKVVSNVRALERLD